jgi:hypothetical protein
MSSSRHVGIMAAALVGLLAATGGLDHINHEAACLESRRAELRSLLSGDPEHLARVLAWAGEHADVAEEAIRRIRMGWCLSSESGMWEPPLSAPLPPLPLRDHEPRRAVVVHGDPRPRPGVVFVDRKPDPGPNRSREAERRRRQAARRGGVLC